MDLSNIIIENTCMLNICIYFIKCQVHVLSRSMTSIEQVNISQMQASSSLEMTVQDYGWDA